MRRTIFSMTLMILGLIALTMGFSATPLVRTVAASPMLQPSPRPPLPPTAEPTTPPEATPETPPEATPDPAATEVPVEDGGSNDDDDDEAALVFGRITGTIIDRRTGAPAGGIRVAVGEQVVSSDSSGNYDVYLPPGGYLVSLMLSAGQGTSAQGPQEVLLASDQVVVVHLFFNSPLPLTPTALQPTAAPIPTPVPTIEPPVAVLPDLPLPETSLDALPVSLPVTAVPFSLGEPWVWMLLGSCLMGLGALVQISRTQRKPRRRARSRRER